METSRYSWEQMPEYYHASYFNEQDYKNGKTFIIIDNITKREYKFPKTETIRNKFGEIQVILIIEDNLRNEEFIAWAISTSKDFINYVYNNWLTTNVLYHVVNHYEFPQIFDYNRTNQIKLSMTKDLWNIAFQRNKDVMRYIPKEYVTSEMINSLSEIKNPSIVNIDDKYLTPELFEIIYYNSDSENKLLLIPPAPSKRADAYNKYNGEGVKNLITKKIADDILSINIRTIWQIPKNFITKEIAIKAMETDPSLIAYVPVEYQTLKYQKMAIDKKPENLSLIDSNVLTDDMIYYALSKKGSVLSSVPKERRTLEICNYAISNYGNALKSVPNNIKNSELCFKAVKKNPKAIRYVPIELLNHEFVNNLNTAGVVIPMKSRSYVNECLIAHDKLDGQQYSFEDFVSNTPKLEINTNCSEIKLESLSGLLTDGSLKLLSKNNISTVEDLLNISDNNDLYNMLLNNSNTTCREILGAIRLLKCKYMGIDPMIIITDTKDDFKDMKVFGKEIGFSMRTENILCRAGISPKKLYELMHDPNKEAKLYRLRNAGDLVVQEIIFKMSIITDFYDEKEKKETSAKDKTIEELKEELIQIRTEIQRLNTRTDEISAILQEKIDEKNKNFVLKMNE